MFQDKGETSFDKPLQTRIINVRNKITKNCDDFLPEIHSKMKKKTLKKKNIMSKFFKKSLT